MSLTKELTMKRDGELNRWVQDYGTAVLKFCFVYLGDAGQAEDAMQETFLKAWRHMDQFKGENVKGWLMSIAVNVCHDSYRRQKRWHRDLEMMMKQVPPAIEDVLDEDKLLFLDIMRLPEHSKQVILLYYYQDMTQQEISKVLKISRSLVCYRLNKAESLLRNIAAKEGLL